MKTRDFIVFIISLHWTAFGLYRFHQVYTTTKGQTEVKRSATNSAVLQHGPPQAQAPSRAHSHQIALGVNEMKPPHVLDVAMRGDSKSKHKNLQSNCKAGSTRQRMKTQQVRLVTHGWCHPELLTRVGDFVVVENKYLARLQAAGSEVFAYHPDGTFLCKGEVHVTDRCLGGGVFIVLLVNSRDNGSEQRSWSYKRCSGSYSRTNTKRPRR